MSLASLMWSGPYSIIRGSRVVLSFTRTPTETIRSMHSSRCLLEKWVLEKGTLSATSTALLGSGESKFLQPRCFLPSSSFFFLINIWIRKQTSLKLNESFHLSLIPTSFLPEMKKGSKCSLVALLQIRYRDGCFAGPCPLQWDSSTALQKRAREMQNIVSTGKKQHNAERQIQVQGLYSVNQLSPHLYQLLRWTTAWLWKAVCH